MSKNDVLNSKLVFKLYAEGRTIEEIARKMECSVDETEEVISKFKEHFDRMGVDREN